MGDNEAAKELLTLFDATAAPARPAPDAPAPPTSPAAAPTEPSRTRRLADDLSDEDAAPAPKRPPRWTSDEEARLRTLVGELGGEKWKTIAERLGTGRTGHAVEQKWAREQKLMRQWATKNAVAPAAAPVEKKKRAYRCGRCGLPKAGHICKRPQADAPAARRTSSHAAPVPQTSDETPCANCGGRPCDGVEFERFASSGKRHKTCTTCKADRTLRKAATAQGGPGHICMAEQKSARGPHNQI